MGNYQLLARGGNCPKVSEGEQGKNNSVVYRTGFCLVSVPLWEPRIQLVFNKVSWFSGTYLLTFEHYNCSLGEIESSKEVDFCWRHFPILPIHSHNILNLAKDFDFHCYVLGVYRFKKGTLMFLKKHITCHPKFKYSVDKLWTLIRKIFWNSEN